jgi:hypothetical protein
MVSPQTQVFTFPSAHTISQGQSESDSNPDKVPADRIASQTQGESAQQDPIGSINNPASSDYQIRQDAGCRNPVISIDFRRFPTVGYSRISLIGSDNIRQLELIGSNNIQHQIQT